MTRRPSRSRSRRRSARGARAPAESCRGTRRCRGSISSEYSPTSLARAGQPLHQRRGLVDAAAPRQRADQPERAVQEAALPARHAIVGMIAIDDVAVPQQPVDRVDRAADALAAADRRSRRAAASAGWRRRRGCRRCACSSAARRTSTRVSTNARIAVGLAPPPRRRARAGSSPRSASRTARSSATQHITFECVK